MFLNDEETKNRETKTAHTKMDAIFILYIKTNDNISIVYEQQIIDMIPPQNIEYFAHVWVFCVK